MIDIEWIESTIASEKESLKYWELMVTTMASSNPYDYVNAIFEVEKSKKRIECLEELKIINQVRNEI
jgi:hypothetical protein